MQFKITIITGIFFLFISSLSIAKPISKNKKPSQKTEQTKQKKRSFAERIFHKRLKKHLKNNENPTQSARLSLIMGSLSLPFLVLGFFVFPTIALLGLGFALGAVVIGLLEVKKYRKGTKNNKFLRIGLILGAIT